MYWDLFWTNHKVTYTDPEFILHLYPLGVEENEAYVTIDLKVRFPKSYPNKPPELHLINSKGLSPLLIQQLLNSLQKTAQGLLGQEMMYDLSDLIRAFLANHNTPPPPTSKLTLHEQMVIRNEHDLKVEKEREIEEQNRKRKEREAELRVQSAVMNEKIQQDIERKREHARAAREERQQKLVGFTDTAEDDIQLDFQYMNSNYDMNTDSKLILFDNSIVVPIEKEEANDNSKVMSAYYWTVIRND